MVSKKNDKTWVNVVRWVARLWSLVLLVFVLAMAFSPEPDPYATGEPMNTSDMVLLVVWGVSLGGLLLGWLWERLGAWIAIAALLLRELLYILFRGEWFFNFLLIWLVFLPPAVMYLLAWSKTDHNRFSTTSDQV